MYSKVIRKSHTLPAASGNDLEPHSYHDAIDNVPCATIYISVTIQVNF